MAITKEQYLDKLLEGYVSNYNIFREEEQEPALKARAELHMEESQCFIFKEAKMWSAESDEYCYFFLVDRLTKEMAEHFVQYSYDEGFPKIKLDHVTLKHQHMCTRLVCTVICDSIDEDAAKYMQKCSIYKSFQFSLKGWMEVHTAVVDLGKRSVLSNRYGKETAKYMKNVLSKVSEGS